LVYKIQEISLNKYKDAKIFYNSSAIYLKKRIEKSFMIVEQLSKV
jgi:hypothetical protein